MIFRNSQTITAPGYFWAVFFCESGADVLARNAAGNTPEVLSAHALSEDVLKFPEVFARLQMRRSALVKPTQEWRGARSHDTLD